MCETLSVESVSVCPERTDWLTCYLGWEDQIFDRSFDLFSLG